MYRFTSHTGEAEVEFEAPTEAGVFAEAVHAFAELLDAGPGKAATRELHVDAADRTTLLAEWLGELVFLAETDGFVPEHVVELDLADRSLHAVVTGRVARPRHLVKAVTYHDLSLEERDGGWFARVVLDV
ncbi:MAG TPA: archease [Gaiellaceae bacterium]|nr:archease [Gaiellaceae bacterium]